ncbi:hypothetical protein QBC47DRAFT_453394 [Echria macrotheca]|uniref:NAD(P)-binding protein n=1 Tax=Echria macrotheca TaxID=438768 RepID=A0AAJ0F4M0_9PEZI|nr:hypothetical protein QBC47DRAFT_453394 [Echria macrotheca]
MAEIIYSEETAKHLAGKVVVVAGGAQGIGAATVTHLHALGAQVFFGDIDAEKGTALETSLSSSSSSLQPSTPAPVFKKVDVSHHDDLLDLFETAYAGNNRVDAAIFCAAVGEPSGVFDPDCLTREKLLAGRGTETDAEKKVGRVVDVNLVSAIHFSRIAIAYFSSSPHEDGFTPSLTLVSSIAGITPAPGLTTCIIRTNTLCPWATKTRLLTPPILKKWISENLPLNTPADVARFIVQCVADTELNGRVVYVAGGRGFDVEGGIEGTRGVWMGVDNHRVWERGQGVLGSGGDWTSQ